MFSMVMGKIITLGFFCKNHYINLDVNLMKKVNFQNINAFVSS